jgi:hypothetical protein
MSDFNFGVVMMLATFAPAILFLIIPLTIMYFMYRKDFTVDQKKRYEEEIKLAIPFTNISEAKRHALSLSIKIILWYGSYFIIVIPILVFLFGNIQYGPNVPYLVLLIATGIPWLACFIQSMLISEKQRLRMQASELATKSPSVFMINGIMIIPVTLLVLILVVLRISNQVLH